MNNREKFDLENTTDSTYFNKLYKKNLEQQGEINCSYCQYNKGENNKGNYYGGRIKSNGKKKIKWPSWKLATKNKKQWMPKPKEYMVVESEIRYGYGYTYCWVEINF